MYPVRLVGRFGRKRPPPTPRPSAARIARIALASLDRRVPQRAVAPDLWMLVGHRLLSGSRSEVCCSPISTKRCGNSGTREPPCTCLLDLQPCSWGSLARCSTACLQWTARNQACVLFLTSRATPKLSSNAPPRAASLVPRPRAGSCLVACAHFPCDSTKKEGPHRCGPSSDCLPAECHWQGGLNESAGGRLMLRTKGATP